MGRIHTRIGLFMMVVLMLTQVAWAAPIQNVQVQENQSLLQNIRYSQTTEKLRIVFDVSTLPEVTARLDEPLGQLIIDFENAANKVNMPKIVFSDQAVSSLQLSEVKPGRQQAVIDLKTPIVYKIFTLSNPNRVVVDIIREQKIEEQVAPGIKYTSLLRFTPEGPVSAYIVDIALGSGYILKPVLSNDAIGGLERLQSMAERNKAIVAVNGSYFALSGEILGLLKMDGEIVSTSEVERTVFGLLPDGTMLIDQVDYQGTITLPDGRTVAITGVNHERGPDNLILYNNYYDSTTGTNSFGSDYIINNGKIIAIAHGDAAIPPGGVVLSAHGTMEKALADLKVGDKIKINQTLGNKWDKTSAVMGAGPRLVKNGSIFLTSNVEEFPSDITSGRAPRTALGITKDGHVLLTVVDGRQKHSIGMTLLELGMLMQEWGAVDAMNFDGGGSSEMIVGNRIVNKPSDGRERLVGDALLIVPKI